MFSSLLLFVCIFNAASSIDVPLQNNVVFTEENWEKMLEGEWLVKFFAPWCPACRALELEWARLADWATYSHPDLSIGSVDITEQNALNGRFMVTSLPTIYHVINGEYRIYKQTRDLQNLQDFVLKEKWRQVDPVSSWISPTSVLMSGVGKIFHFSMMLKDAHTTLNKEYNIPTWIAYLLFALTIITIGLLMGVALVLFTDRFSPSEPHPVHADQVKYKDDTIDGATGHNEFENEVDEKKGDLRKRKVEPTNDVS